MSIASSSKTLIISLCYGGPQYIRPNIVGKYREIYRFLCVPYVLFNMAPRNKISGDGLDVKVLDSFV